MMYPLSLLNANDVATMVEKGATRCSHLILKDAYNQVTGIRGDVDWTDIVHFWNGDIEIGYCNTFCTPPTIFATPRNWGDEQKAAQRFYDMGTGEPIQ